MTVRIMRGDARHLDLPDTCVDLIVTSPPYWAQRSYRDGGEHYAGQIGDEPTPQEYVDHLVECMREWVRVLKPEGNIWLNLGDKYVSYEAGRTNGRIQSNTPRPETESGSGLTGDTLGRHKSLLGLPWRVALRCMDELSLILRAEIIWGKKNGLPESVTDRVRRSHEQWFHFAKQPKHYAAVDRIRTQVKAQEGAGLSYQDRKNGLGRNPNPDVGHTYGSGGMRAHVLGALPNTVWMVATEPLIVPEHIAHAKCCAGVKRPCCENGLQHFAAFPIEFPRLIIDGWAPSGICTACGEGRHPASEYTEEYAQHRGPGTDRNGANRLANGAYDLTQGNQTDKNHIPPASRIITGEVCKCTPYTDHPGERQPPRKQSGPDVVPRKPARSLADDERKRTGPWREYHYDQWDAAPTKPALVVDPFGGTGTVSLVAEVLGRDSVYNDMSADYCFLAEWRINDPDERARALRVARPPKQVPDQISLFEAFGESVTCTEPENVTP